VPLARLNDIGNNFQKSFFFYLQPTNATFLDLFISTDDLYVAGGSSAHH
jgi:hypothetical protein